MMELFGADLEKKNRRETVWKIGDLWKSCSTPEQFFLELAVKFPETPKTDLLAMEAVVLEKRHPLLFRLMCMAMFLSVCPAVMAVCGAAAAIGERFILAFTVPAAVFAWMAVCSRAVNKYSEWSFYLSADK